MQVLSEYIESHTLRAVSQLDDYAERSRVHQEERSRINEEDSSESMIEQLSVAILKARANGWKILSNVVGIASTNQQ